MAKYQTLSHAGAPTDGVNEVQRITKGGTISGGTWDLTIAGETITLIPWNVTHAALEALVQALVPGVLVTGGPIASAAFNFEYTGPVRGGLGVDELTADATKLTGAAHALNVSTPTPGVPGTFRGAGGGTRLQDITNGILYENTGTDERPVWTAVTLPETSSWVLTEKVDNGASIVTTLTSV